MARRNVIEEILAKRKAGADLTVEEQQILTEFETPKPVSQQPSSVDVEAEAKEPLDAQYQGKEKAVLLKFGEEATEDNALTSIALAISSIVYKNRKVNESLPEGSEEVGESYEDEATRDRLMEMHAKCKTPNAKLKVSSAIGHIIANASLASREKLAELYDNDATWDIAREGFMTAESEEDIALATRALCGYSYVNGGKRAHDPEVFEKLIKLLPGTTNELNRSYIVTTLGNFASNPETRSECIKEDTLRLLLDEAKKAKTDGERGSFAGLIANLAISNPQLREGEMGQEVKALLLEWSKTAESERSAIGIGGALNNLSHKDETTKEVDPLFGDVETKEKLFKLGRAAKGPEAISCVASALGNITSQLYLRRKENPDAEKEEIYGDEATHDFIMELAAKIPNDNKPASNKARGSIAHAISGIVLGEKGGERFCNTETKDLLLDYSDRVTDDRDIANVAAAIGNIAYHEAQMAKKASEANRNNVFLGDESVEEALNKMRDKLPKDSAAHTTTTKALKTVNPDALKWRDQLDPDAASKNIQQAPVATL
jgi:hypothetical protein